MRLTVIRNSLSIRVEASAYRFVSFPGEWAPSDVVENDGEEKRQDGHEKFYVERLTDLFWEGDGIREAVNDVELRRCVLAIKAEAERKGWRIVFPQQGSNGESV